MEMRPFSRSTTTIARSTSSSGGACAPEPAAPEPAPSPGLDVMTSIYPAHDGHSSAAMSYSWTDRPKVPQIPAKCPPTSQPGPIYRHALPSWSVRHRGEDLLLGERQRAHADTEGVAEGVGDGRGGGALRGFSDAQRRILVTRQQLHLHRGHLGEPQNRIAVPGVAGHGEAVETHAFLQRPTGRLDRAALDLVLSTVGVDH